MAIFGKTVYASGISVQSLLFYRFLIAAMVMLPIALLQKKKFPKPRDFCILIGMGFIGYAGQSFCFFSSLTLIPAPLVAILLYLYPVFVAVLSIFFLDEQLDNKKITALFLAISGTVLVVGFEPDGNVKGILLGVSAAVIYAVYNIVGARVMSRNDPFTASIVVIASAWVFYLGYNMKTGLFIPNDGVVWVNILAIAVLCTAVAIYAYFHGIKLTGAVNAAMLSTFEPVTTMVLAGLFLGQKIGWIQVGGAAMVLSSAVIVAGAVKKRGRSNAQTNGKIA